MLDQKTQQFLDNIIKGASNEELFAASRMPANVQVEPVSIVEGEAKVRPIEFDTGYKFQSQQTQPYVENVNRALEGRLQDKEAFAANAAEAFKKRQEQEINLKNIVNQAQQAKTPYQRPDELKMALTKAQQDASNLQKMPEQDLASQAILSFAPALFGAIGGESAAISQVKGGQQARDLVAAQRKEQSENINKQNEQIMKKYEQLVKIDSQLADDWLAKQKLDTEQARLGADILKFGVGLTDKDLSRSEQLASQASKDVLMGSVAGTKEATKLEGEPAKEAAKNQRAATLAANKPPTEGQSKGAFQLGLMQQAEQNLQDIKQKNKGYPSLNQKFFRVQREIQSGGYGGTLMSDLLNSDIIDKPTRSQIQAELQFLESIGRIQSGAAISAGEWLNMREQYFPTYGDGKDSVSIKEQQRKQALGGLKIIAGRAASQVPKAQSVISQEQEAAISFDDKKAKRLQELRKKRDAGKLGQ